MQSFRFCSGLALVLCAQYCDSVLLFSLFFSLNYLILMFLGVNSIAPPVINEGASAFSLKMMFKTTLFHEKLDITMI
jgi:hypothetical protein